MHQQQFVPPTNFVHFNHVSKILWHFMMG